jgi:hypothetical protein
MNVEISRTVPATPVLLFLVVVYWSAVLAFFRARSRRAAQVAVAQAQGQAAASTFEVAITIPVLSRLLWLLLPPLILIAAAVFWG